jgi:hypothetical protein
MELKQDGDTFDESSSFDIYRYEDSEIESDCESAVVDTATEVIGPGGGEITLSDMTLTFRTDSLSKDTEVIVKKMLLDCPDLLVAEELPDDVVARVLAAALEEEPSEEAPPADNTILYAIVLILVLMAVAVFLNRRK